MLNNLVRSILIGGVLSLFSLPTLADNAGALLPEPPLQKLFELAITNNPTLDAVAAKQLAAQGQVELAESQQQPSVTLKSELSYAWMKNKDFARSANQLRASYPLYQPKLNDQLSVAKYENASSDSQFKAQRQTLLRKVAQAYFQYRAQQAQVAYLAKEQLSIETILSQVEQRFTIGYQDLNDIAEIRARLDKSLAEQLLAQQQLDVMATNLEQLVGQPIHLTEWNIPEQLPEMRLDQYQAALSDLRQHPELHRIQLVEKAAQQQVALVKNQDGIQLEAFGAYVYNDSNGNFYDDMQGLKGGLQLTLPLYLSGQTDAKVAIARAQSKQLNAQYRDAERILSAQIKSSWLTYQSGLKRLEALHSVLSSSQQAFQAAENGLSTGNRNIIDLLNTQRRLQLAERDLPILKSQIWQAWYQLQWALGKLDT